MCQTDNKGAASEKGRDSREPAVIGFFHEDEQPYGAFSNWYPAEFEYAGKHFANAEQFMMYHKVMTFGKHDLAGEIMAAADPAKCKKIGRRPFPEFDPLLWEKIGRTIVKRGVHAKFQQNRQIRDILLGTGDALLAECSPYDRKWGIGIDISDPDRLDVRKWKGDNCLGMVLMEVREELRRDLMAAPDGKLRYADARHAEPIREWQMTAGELKRIPQYYRAIHAYSDTLTNPTALNAFYYGARLCDWEVSMRMDMGGGLPAVGFYEMKQEIYETAARINGAGMERAKRLEFCRRYLPILEAVTEDGDLSGACRAYSVYTQDNPHQELAEWLYHNISDDAYAAGMVVTNYGDLVEESGMKERVNDPTEEELDRLDAVHLLGCIAWHFRKDHFDNGSLVHDIGSGVLLRLLRAYVKRERQAEGARD